MTSTSGREHSTTCADLKTTGPHDFQPVDRAIYDGQLSGSYGLERCSRCGMPRYTTSGIHVFRRDHLPGVPDRV